MRYRILQKLKKNGGKYVSGEILGNMLGISRTAVWKHICELRRTGYKIESSSRKGYKLAGLTDVLNCYEIGCNLGTKTVGRKIFHFDVIDSTNNYAKKIAVKGCEDGTVVIAESQTSGRGRLGRPWESAGNKGMWMSVVLHPAIVPGNIQIITLAASVAVVEGIRKVTGIETGIKWPNDIMLKGKKVCGILTEMYTKADSTYFLVLGIGLNINHEYDDFPADLKETTTSLKIYALEEGVLKELRAVRNDFGDFDRNIVTRGILEELDRVCNGISNGQTDDIIVRWKKHSVTIGREVEFYTKQCKYSGTAVDVTGDGKLAVCCSDGITREVVSGEIILKCNPP